MCVCFNAMILGARGLPLLDILETVRLILMKRIHVRRDQMKKYSREICPAIQQFLENLKKKSNDFIVHRNGDTKLEAEDSYAIFFYRGEESEAYVDECYHKETFLRINESGSWPDSEIPPLLPLEHEKLPSRRKKNNRIKQLDEINLEGKKVAAIAKSLVKENDIVRWRRVKKADLPRRMVDEKPACCTRWVRGDGQLSNGGVNQ
ncbi:hypothetical protein CRG98_039102 [Punica granatum]|uniref:Uncharacterized protein n=1 Tax=Punica granatum TaxID=22663 RepID=A0A2I0IAS9_PUNGR|nr:hypothetical protein CRG98_039102 [Punica granatum]